MAIQKPSHTCTKIDYRALRTNLTHILLAISFTVFINTQGLGQTDLPQKGKTIAPKEKEQPISIPLDSLIKPKNENIVATTPKDSTVLDSVKPRKKEFLQGTVTYKAKDYTSFNKKEEKLYLYNEAEVYYQDMEIRSGIIVIDYKKNEVYAGRIKDSLGEYIQAPIFKQGNNLVEPDSIRFNFDSKKALIFNSKTEQNGGTIIAERSKKENDSVYYIQRGKFTTSKNLDDPEYYFLMRKAKIVPNKKVITGVTNLFIYDVPTPIGLPFAFFPLTQKQTSGVLFPTFGEQNERGYFFQNGGYYFAISDYFDLAVMGDYYTNGSYATRFESRYAKRYKFRGNLSFRLESLISGEIGFPNYNKTSQYNIQWQHSQDAKANPNSRFSASVNLGSSRYYQNSINEVNLAAALVNNLSSSVSYSKTFQGDPQVNVTLAATQNQNTQTKAINLTLPTLQANVARIFPFAPKTGIKKGAFQNINLQYSVRAENTINKTDSLFLKKAMFDNVKIGAQHSIPLSTNFKVLKYLSVSAGASYNEVWTLNTVEKSYDNVAKKEVVTDLNKFGAFRTYNFNSSLGTTLYGMFNFDKKGKGKAIQTIRHVVRPSLSYNINPAFKSYYDSYDKIVDADLNTIETVEYTRFDNSGFGVPGKTYSSAIGIGLSNAFEAKVRDSDTTKVEPKKIMLLNSLNFSTGYNVAGDSLQWSAVRMSGGTQLFNNKMNVNFGASLDPYALDNKNQRINTFNIDNNGSLFRLTNANIAVNYSLKSDDFKTKKATQASRDRTQQSGGRADDLFGRSLTYEEEMNDTEELTKDEELAKLYNYAIPWSLRLAYSINYSNAQRQNQFGSQSLMFSGDVELSPRWKVGLSSGFDFVNKGVTFTQLRFQRDLLSWRMNFGLTLRGSSSFWNFFIGIKSGLLKDIKYDKQSRPDKIL